MPQSDIADKTAVNRPGKTYLELDLLMHNGVIILEGSAKLGEIDEC